MLRPRWETQFAALNRNEFWLLVNTYNYVIYFSTLWIESRVPEIKKKKKVEADNRKSMLRSEVTNWKRKLLIKKNRNNAANGMLNFNWFHFSCIRLAAEIGVNLWQRNMLGSFPGSQLISAKIKRPVYCVLRWLASGIQLELEEHSAKFIDYYFVTAVPHFHSFSLCATWRMSNKLWEDLQVARLMYVR